VTQSMLDANLAISDPLEASIKLSDPLIDHYLGVKRAAWTVRLNLGLASFKGQTLVSAGQAMSARRSVCLVSEHGPRRRRLESGRRSGGPRRRTARSDRGCQRASASFTEHYADDMKSLIDALATHQPTSTDAKGLQKISAENNAAVVAVSNVALDQMVTRAGERAARANLFCWPMELFSWQRWLFRWVAFWWWPAVSRRSRC